MKFEWDDNKASSNLEKHGISFVVAVKILMANPPVYESPKPGNDSKRYIAIGELNGRFYTVIYTVREETYRIISIRRANRAEKRKNSPLHS